MKSKMRTGMPGWLGAACLGLVVGATAAGQEIRDLRTLLTQWRQARQMQKDRPGEATAIYERLLEAAPILLKDMPAEADNLRLSLALLYDRQGRYDRAEPLYQVLVEQRASRLGKDHLDVAQCLLLLATAKQQRGLYNQAEPLLERALKIYEDQPGPVRPEVAQCLNNLAALYESLGRYLKAEPLYQRSLALRQTHQEQAPLPVAASLNNLAGLYVHLGQYDKAESLYQRSLGLRERVLGKDHPTTAQGLNNLAALYQKMGQYDEAEPLSQRCLALYESAPGGELPLATALNNLAGLYKDMGKYNKAEPIYQRSLAIRERLLGQDHAEVAQSLGNLGVLYQNLGRYKEAEALYQRSLQIREARLGPKHPAVANSLSNLATLDADRGKYAAAEPLYQRCLAIREASLGKDHHQVAGCLDNLAALYQAMGQAAKAVDCVERGRRCSRRNLGHLLAGLSEAAQAGLLHRVEESSFHRSLSLALKHAGEPEFVARSAAWVCNGKAIAQQAIAEAALLARDRNDPALADLTRQLLDVRQQLAHLAVFTPGAAQEEQAERNRAEWSRREQDLAKQLRQAGGRSARPVAWVDLEALRRHLPPDTVFIDLARFDVFGFTGQGTPSRWQPAHYAAWITPPPHPTLSPKVGGEGRVRGGEVRLIDLGPADEIDTIITQVRRQLGESRKIILEEGEPDAETSLREPLDRLAKRILHPLLPHIGKSRRWVLSPDGNLWLVPWAALPLPDGKYAVEEHTLQYALSGRDLVPGGMPTNVQPDRPLVLANPDYDLEMGKAPTGPRQPPQTRGLSRTLNLGRVPRLPVTATEAEQIAPKLGRYTQLEPRVYLEKQATVGVFQSVPNPWVVVLSTHGFFLPAPEVAREEVLRVKKWENPLLRCGLLLAGCNNAARARMGADNGVLTGLQIVGTDLRGCELVVLSACDTGLGDIRNGEGVAGLRQAFQLAGARSVVATLWQVADVESARLMIDFFDRLAQGESKAEALCSAQRAMIKARRDSNAAAHPYYWAAFTLTGQTE